MKGNRFLSTGISYKKETKREQDLK